MRRGSLSDREIRALAPPESGQIEIWDSKVPGFGVRISSKGTKSFVLLYRVRGRARRLTIGRYPTYSLADARRKAHLALADIAEGTDPQLNRETASGGDPLQMEFVAAEFIEKYAKVRNRDWQETQRLLTREFASKWRKRSIADITKGDVIVAIDAIVERGSPGAANRAFAIVRRFFNWCVERDLIEASPCNGLKPPTNPEARDRVLSDTELLSIWNAATELGYPFGPIVKLLMLTGQRRGEVTSLTWDSVNIKDGLWSLPKENTKSGRAHEVPLAPVCIEIIQSLPRLHENLIFAARGKNNQVSGFANWKCKIDKMSGVSNWRIHDLRRTAATGMARSGVPPHVVERILNHTSGTFGGVAGVYNRFGYLPEMRDALDLWAKHVIALQDRK